jgi:hypothetical protein
MGLFLCLKRRNFWLKTRHGEAIRAIRSENGTEFQNYQFDIFFVILVLNISTQYHMSLLTMVL